jgi:hypothetical protein
MPLTLSQCWRLVFRCLLSTPYGQHQLFLASCWTFSSISILAPSVLWDFPSVLSLSGYSPPLAGNRNGQELASRVSILGVLWIPRSLHDSPWRATFPSFMGCYGSDHGTVMLKLVQCVIMTKIQDLVPNTITDSFPSWEDAGRELRVLCITCGLGWVGDI